MSKNTNGTDGNQQPASLDLTKAEWEEMGNNIEGTRVGDLLFLKIDMSQELGMAQSGKSMLIATSQGFQSVPGTDPKTKTWFSGNIGRKP